jgi:hypothetical protein
MTHAASVSHYSTAHFSPHYSSYGTAPGVVMHARSGVTSYYSPSGVQSRAQSPRRAPSIAFGGSTATRGVGGPRAFSAPTNVSRGWNRGHIYSWNHHHYRYWNGAWVLYDDGYYPGYDYGYPDGYYGFDYPPSEGYYPPGAVSGQIMPSQDVVADAQNQLSRLGYATGPVDGEIGPMTQSAIAAFQRDHRLSITGQLDPSTLRVLGVPYE